MMTNEMRTIKRELRAFKEEVRRFEKRSKMIKMIRKFEYDNRLTTQINVTKRTRVVDEMIEYFKSLCEFVEEEENGSMWLRNYDDLAEEEDCSSAEYQICVHFVK